MGNNVMAESGGVENHGENVGRAEMSLQQCAFVFLLVLMGFLFSSGFFSFIFLFIMIHVDCGPVA